MPKTLETLHSIAKKQLDLELLTSIPVDRSRSTAWRSDNKMIYLKFRAIACVAILCGVWLFPSGRIFAQAPPGPLPPSHPLPPPPPAPPAKKKPQVEPRKTLAGFWKLNSEESDDPQKKLEEARQTKAGSGAGPGGGSGGGIGGPRVGIGFPVPGGGPNGPNGPYGGGGGGMGGNGGETTEEMRALVRPDFSQIIELKDTEVDSTDDHANKLVFYTDGRKIQKSKDDSLQQISARWNGSQLVTDEKGPRNKKMSRTLELSSDGRQFYETWHIENGRSGSPIVIRYVYDAATEGR